MKYSNCCSVIPLDALTIGRDYRDLSLTAVTRYLTWDCRMRAQTCRKAEPGRSSPHWMYMSDDFTYRITTTRFDEDYSPSSSSRTTTNFANLARGEHRRQNLRRALAMIDDRFNGLAGRADPSRDRYTVELEIVSADLR